jgi:hypothetical protein
MDEKARRRRLKPLVRRSLRVVDREALKKALSRLDDRALGVGALIELRDVLFSPGSKKDKRIWSDPVRIAESVVRAKVLYASRRTSTQEYVFFAAHPVESLCERRWMDGQYDKDLAPISQAMRAVEQQHGVEPVEYWPRGEEPTESARLNRQYEAVLDAKLVEALREFELDDLADLKERTSAEFERLRERGRRSVFHRDEYAPAIRDVVIRYEKDARRAAAVGAYSAAINSLGAGVEGLLILRCLRSSHRAGRISQKLHQRLRPRSPNDPKTWTFETLIEVCLKAGWLPPVETSVAQYDAAGLAHQLRRMRKHVHPGRHARERPWSETDEREYQDADSIYVILLSVLGKARGSIVGETAGN